MDSILKTIKKLLGISDEETHFDTDIIMHINSVFSILHQLGVGPDKSFSIQDDTATWNDFIEDDNNFNDVRTYIYLKVRLLFDPPASSSVMNAMERQISELEWRLNVEGFTKSLEEANNENDELWT